MRKGALLTDYDTQMPGAASAILPFPAPPLRARIMFDRRELQAILNLYGIMVASGEWRDYAIDMLADRAVFSVFRRSSETPLYRIEKAPRNARRQGAFSVAAADGRILKRGQDLANVLRILAKKPKLVT